jgi:hypothetical protein
MLNFQDTHPAVPTSEPFWPPRHPLPRCTGACNQGRLPCQAPAACFVSEDEGEPLSEGEDLFLLCLIVAAVAFLCWMLVLLASTVQGV